MLASKPVTTRLQRSAVVKRDTLGGTFLGLRLVVSFFRDSEMGVGVILGASARRELRC